MDNKGQGALEYLLLIGGAVLVAAIVVAVLANITSTQNNVISGGQGQLNAGQENLIDIANNFGQ